MNQSVEKNFDPATLPEGTPLTCTNYYFVENHVGNVTNVVDSRGNELSITNDIIKDECVPVTEGKETQKITRTEMAELIRSSQKRAFRVRFHCKPKDADVEKVLNEEWESAAPSRKKRKLIRGKVLNGTEKTLVCHLYKDENLMGRAQVIDLEAQRRGEQHPFRQVDYRSIEELWIDNMHYELKK